MRIPITLGELIESLKKCVNEERPNKLVYFDWVHFFPTSFHSWRGDYSMLGLGYENSYGSEQSAHELNKFIEVCEKTNGETFEGWKGGTFYMNLTTPVWVDNYGEGGSTGVVGVKDLGYAVIILTSYCEY